MVAAVVGFFFSGAGPRPAARPAAGRYDTIYFTGPADAFGVQLKIAGFLGIALAMPVILFQRLALRDARAHEARAALHLAGDPGGASSSSSSGSSSATRHSVRAAASCSASPGRACQPLLTIDGYVGFVTTMLLAFGIVLEFPIVLIGLARVGILNYRRLAAQRPLAILAIVLFAIVLTPGGDPISPIILRA